MKKNNIYRGVCYAVGLLLLALGIILNTKCGLGVSPIISVAFSISTIGKFNFGNTTFLLYVTFVLVEMLLHIVHWYRVRHTDHPVSFSIRRVLLFDLLQLPLSLVFTRFLNLFSNYIPAFDTDCAGTFPGTMPGRILILLVAIVLTGVGAAMSLNMRIIPNPGDGIVQAISDTIGKSVGFTKNCFDVCNITFTIAISLLCTGHLIGIGIGTVLAVIGVGRVIALFNHLCWKKLAALTGFVPLSTDAGNTPAHTA